MKMIYVFGDEEYAALEFERAFDGRLVSDIINELIPEPFVGSYEFDEFNIELYEFGDVDTNFIQFIRNTILDYDQSKHENFYFEGETIRF